jgi:Bacterial DNA-binding protein
VASEAFELLAHEPLYTRKLQDVQVGPSLICRKGMHSRAGTQLKSAHSMQALRNASGTWRYAVRSQAPSSVVGARVATKAAPGSTDEVRLKDIVKQIADETEIVQKDVDTICRSFIKCVEDTVAAGGKVQLTGVQPFLFRLSA